jgi:hypothetical protein
MRKTHLVILISIMLLLVAGQVSANMTIPNAFSGGTPAVAAEVNENFATIEEAMPGLEFSTGGFFGLASLKSTVDSLQITAPTSGYIVVSAFGNVTCNNAASSSTLTLENETEAQETNLWTNTVETTSWHRYYITHVFTVGAGTDTINLNGYCSGLATGSINVSSFYAIFIPNRY